MKEEVRTKFNRQLKPSYISTDFESAVLSAITVSFQDTQLAGCLFHFSQALWRKLQAEGLSEEYAKETNVDMREQLNSLIAIAFVPEDDVAETFDIVQEKAMEDLLPILDYLEDNYIRGRRRGKGRRPPMFPPTIWNCHNRVIAGLPRTTNTCETWHNRLNTLMGKHHPSFYTLLKNLQEEVAEINRDIVKLESEHSPTKKKKYDDLDKRIKRTVEQYEEYKGGRIYDYLVRIGNNIAGNFKIS